MNKVTIATLLLVYSFTQAQVNSLDDEDNAILSFSELLNQSCSSKSQTDDWDEGIRQRVEFDAMSMNIIFYRTPYKSGDDKKQPNEIAWSARFIIPVYEIAEFKGDSKNKSITITMKDGKYSIQGYKLKSNDEYYSVVKDSKLIYQSENLGSVRNLVNRLNGHVLDLQIYYQKKVALIDLLNKQLRKEVKYQIADSLNYPSDKRFAVKQEFQLSNDNTLSLIVQRENSIEKQSVHLSHVIEVLKDVNVILSTKADAVTKSIVILSSNEKMEVTDNLFFLQLCYERNNENVGDEIVDKFARIGLTIKKTFWED